jgi:catalase
VQCELSRNPVSSPLAPVHNDQRDGMHRQVIARGRVHMSPTLSAVVVRFRREHYDAQDWDHQVKRH